MDSAGPQVSNDKLPIVLEWSSARMVNHPGVWPIYVAVKFCAPRPSTFPKDTRHFPNREWLSSRPSFKPRRILSRVLHQQEVPIVRGNSRISCCKLKILKGLGLRGGPGRDRTDDLFHAISKGELRRSDTERNRTTQNGSVHAGFKHVRCLLCVPERHCQKRPDTGRDGRVMTQTTTQSAWTAKRMQRRMGSGRTEIACERLQALCPTWEA